MGARSRLECCYGRVESRSRVESSVEEKGLSERATLLRLEIKSRQVLGGVGISTVHDDDQSQCESIAKEPVTLREGSRSSLAKRRGSRL